MKERKSDQFIKKPFYLGGNGAFREFIYSQLKYPKEALENKIEGIVLSRYEIDYKGNVTSVKVKKGIGYGCDEEAMRIIKLLKFEIPKEPRKLRVMFHKDIKIKFQLPKLEPNKKPKLPTSVPSAVQYSVVLKKQSKTTIPVSKEKPKSYNYTVEW